MTRKLARLAPPTASVGHRPKTCAISESVAALLAMVHVAVRLCGEQVSCRKSHDAIVVRPLGHDTGPAERCKESEAGQNCASLRPKGLLDPWRSHFGRSDLQLMGHDTK